MSFVPKSSPLNNARSGQHDSYTDRGGGQTLQNHPNDMVRYSGNREHHHPPPQQMYSLPRYSDYLPRPKPLIDTRRIILDHLIHPTDYVPRSNVPPMENPGRWPVPSNPEAQPPPPPPPQVGKKLPVVEPLSVDVSNRKAAYTPQVEAISPTNPAEDHLRATKEDLLQQINKVDREIFQIEQKMSRLREKEAELEKNATAPIDEKREETEAPKHQSLAQRIYTENRKKASESHAFLKRFGYSIDVPLYNQPSDCPAVAEIIRQNLIFRPRLILHLRKVAQTRNQQNQTFAAAYNQQLNDWQREVERIENSAKRKARDAKTRELFEKTFPELRKQREEKERLSRVGSRVKSEADLEEIMDNLQVQDMEERKMRALSVIPPIMLTERERRYQFINTNGVIDDFAKEYKERQYLNYWSPEEHEVFKERYLQQPKNFYMISLGIDRKTYQDCILHYYSTKKQENYKQLLRKSRQGRTRASRSNLSNKQALTTVVTASTSSSTDSFPGVTTRFQREQLQRQDPNAAATSGMTVPAMMPTVPAMVDIPASLIAPSETMMSCDLNKTAVDSAMETNTTNDVEKGLKAVQTDEPMMVDALEEDVGCSNQDSGGPHPCVICNESLGSYADSRPLRPQHAHFYGLNESIGENARICFKCKRKVVKSQSLCPLTSCLNLNKCADRLYALPAKLNLVSSQIRDDILKEFHVFSNECCASCYAKISKKLNEVISAGASSKWSEHEIETVKACIKEHGANWSLIAKALSTRTYEECKEFYDQYGKDHNLHLILKDYDKSHWPLKTPEDSRFLPVTGDVASVVISRAVNEESDSVNDACMENANKSLPSDTVIYPLPSGSAIESSTSPAKTVKDLMANVIEKQLMKSPGGVSIFCSGPPTISSILSTSQGYKKNYEPMASKPTISSYIRNPEPVASQKESVVVMQVPQPVPERRSYETETLDLSVKKRDSATYSAPPQHYPYNSLCSKSNVEPVYYMPSAKAQPTVALQPSRSPMDTKEPMVVPKPPHKLMPATSVPKQGSITHGTPVRSEGLLMQIPTPHDKLRSVPVQQHPDKRPESSYDSYKRSSPAPAMPYNIPHPQSRHITSLPPEQQLISRQNIMSDYITSQQMHALRRYSLSNDKNDPRPQTAQMYYSPPPPPPPQPPGGVYMDARTGGQHVPSQMRQGVIQRHNTVILPQNRPLNEEKPDYPPPGCEVLTSFVDVAVQQPSLPVPPMSKKPHESQSSVVREKPSGGRIPPSYSQERDHEHRYQPPLIRRESLHPHLPVQRQQPPPPRVEHRTANVEPSNQPRLDYEMKQRHREQIAAFLDAQQRGPRDQDRLPVVQQRKDSPAAASRKAVQDDVTAATLIDAIITHQINQNSASLSGGNAQSTSETNQRPGDRLFQAFHRDRSPVRSEANGKLLASMKRAGSPLDRAPVKGVTIADTAKDYSVCSYSGEEESYRTEGDERQIVRIVQPQPSQKPPPMGYHEPVSPPDQWSSSRGYEKPSHLSPLDYVKNRIVEVMRTSEDKEADEKPSGERSASEEVAKTTSSPSPSVNYSYASIVKKSDEPAPILSAQYEPLSDED